MNKLKEHEEGTFHQLKSSFREIFGKPEGQTDKQPITEPTTTKTKGETL